MVKQESQYGCEKDEARLFQKLTSDYNFTLTMTDAPVPRPSWLR